MKMIFNFISKLLKYKKVVIVITTLILLNAFGLFSLNQVDQKVSQFVTENYKSKLLRFGKQMGLEIEWEKLHFNLLTLNFDLKKISLKTAENKISKQKYLFNLFDGSQQIDTLLIRPNLISLLFKNQLSLSKIKVIGGRINLKTAKKINTNTRKKHFDLPIKKIEIKNTDISLKHLDSQILLSQINAHFKKGHRKYSFKGNVNQAKLDQEKPFIIKAKGSLSQENIHMDYLDLKNNNIDMQASPLDLNFKRNKLVAFKVKTFGKLSFSSLHKLAQVFNQNTPDSEGVFSYILDTSFNRASGYKGSFELKSEDFHFRKKSVKSFHASGKFDKYSILIEKAQAQLKKQGTIKLRQTKVGMLRPYPISLSSSIENLPFLGFLQLLYPVSFSPIETIYSGDVDCEGELSSSNLKCDIKSRPINLHIRGKKRIITLYQTQIDSKLRLEKSQLLFEFSGLKNSTTNLDLKGQYDYGFKKWILTLNGKTKLKEDMKIHVPLSLTGDVSITNGVIQATKNDLIIDGFLRTKNFTMNGYDIDQVNSFMSYRNNKIHFKNIAGNKGKTSYNGNLSLDLKKNQVTTAIQSSFFNIQDILKITEKNKKWPFSISGTGEGSLNLTSSFSNFKEKSFQLKASLFNSVIVNENFKTVSLDISSKKGKGLISLLELQREQGKITTKGTFDKNLNLDLFCKGSDLSLERIRNLNQILPFQQSGQVSFDMHLQGSLYKPKASINANITHANLYIYPVKDSKLLINIDSKGVTASGRLMENIFISKFFYPLTKGKLISVAGSFKNADVIKTTLARYKKENPQNYLSQITGDAEATLSRDTWSPINGKVAIQNLYISRGNKWVQNQDSFSIVFKNRNYFLNPVSFYHHDSKILHIKKKGGDQLHISGRHSLDYWSFAFLSLENLEGDVQAELTINKNLNHLNPNGILEVNEGLLDFKVIPAFKDVSATLKMNNDKIFIEKFSSTLGKGSGEISLNQSKKMAVNLNLDFSDAYLNIPDGFYTTGSGTLNLSGKSSPYLLKGSYLINSGIIKSDFSKSTQSKFFNAYSLLKDQNTNNTALFNLDIDLKTDNPIKIENSFINAGIAGAGKIYGPLNNLLMKGQFSTINQETPNTDYIIFKDQEFAINTGMVKFNNSPPNNPTLNITAQTLFTEKNIESSSLRGEDEATEYKISLTAKGPTKKLDIKLESQPALNQKEIISLLALGVKTQYFEGHIKENTTQYSYQLLGSFLLQKPLSRELKNKLGLNLNISPTLNTYTNEPVTKITLRKDWLGKFQTSFSRTLEEFPTSDASIKYDMSRNYSLTASWLNSNQYVVLDEFSEKDHLSLDFEFNFEF